MKNDETLKTTTVTIKNGNTVNVDLVLENSVAISLNSDSSSSSALLSSNSKAYILQYSIFIRSDCSS